MGGRDPPGKSSQELDDVGSVFGSNCMSFETLDSQNVEGLVQLVNPKWTTSKDESPEVDRKTDRIHDLLILQD